MVNSFLNAVTTQLGKTFGATYHYYVENVEQGLMKPCFTVDCIIPLQRSKSPILYDRTIPLVVHYFDNDKAVLKKDCYEMAERLTETLEYIPFKSTLIRGENISWQIVDDVLQVFVTYKFTTKTDLPFENAMEDLSETNISSK